MANVSTGSVPKPHAVTAERCDECENLFLEMLLDEHRYTFACGHVFCRLCFDQFQERGDEGHYVDCRRCKGCLVRASRTTTTTGLVLRNTAGAEIYNSVPCTHPVPYMEFHPRDYRPGQPFWDPRCRLLVGQKSEKACQLCRLRAALRNLSLQTMAQSPLWPFPGETYACVQVNGYAIHGLRFEDATAAVVDWDNDVELPRPAGLIEDMTSNLCGLLARFPTEPRFLPLGELTLTFRVRGWVQWARANPGIMASVQQQLVPETIKDADNEGQDIEFNW